MTNILFYFQDLKYILFIFLYTIFYSIVAINFNLNILFNIYMLLLYKVFII